MAVLEAMTQMGPRRTVRPTRSMEIVSAPKLKRMPACGNQGAESVKLSAAPPADQSKRNARIANQKQGMSVPARARLKMVRPPAGLQKAMSPAKTSGRMTPTGRTAALLKKDSYQLLIGEFLPSRG